MALMMVKLLLWMVMIMMVTSQDIPTIQWIAMNGEFDTASNWNTGNVPMQSDVAAISTFSSVVHYNMNNQTVTAMRVSMEPASNGNVTLIIANDMTVTNYTQVSKSNLIFKSSTDTKPITFRSNYTKVFSTGSMMSIQSPLIFYGYQFLPYNGKLEIFNDTIINGNLYAYGLVSAIIRNSNLYLYRLDTSAPYDSYSSVWRANNFLIDSSNIYSNTFFYCYAGTNMKFDNSLLSLEYGPNTLLSGSMNFFNSILHQKQGSKIDNRFATTFRDGSQLIMESARNASDIGLVSSGSLLFFNSSLNSNQSNSVFNKFSVTNFTTSIYYSYGSGIYFVDNATLNVINGSSMTLVSNNLDLATMHFRNSTSCNILDSVISVQGIMLFDNNSVVKFLNSSVTISLNTYVTGNALMSAQTSQFYIGSDFRFTENSISTFNQSNLVLTNYTLVNLNATVTITNSNLTISAGQLQVDSAFTSSQSMINISSQYVNNGNSTIQNSLLNIGGSLLTNGIFNTYNSIVTVLNGNINMSSTQSYFYSKQSIINIPKGNFYYVKGSKLILEESLLFNEDGILESRGDISLDSNSNITNSGQFILSSNVNLANQSSATITNQTYFQNNGRVQVVNSDSGDVSNQPFEINVPVFNNGLLDIESHLSVFRFQQGNDNAIWRLVNNSIVSSNQTFEVIRGRLIGNGTISGNVTAENVIIGDDDANISLLNINGSIVQGPNSTITILLNSITDFTQINITNQFITNGTIKIRVNKNAQFQKNQQVDVMNYNEKVGGVSRIQVVTYDPNSGEETPSSDCVEANSKTKSMSVLFTCEKKEESKLFSISKGAVAAIVVCSAAVIVGASLLYHYRDRLHIRIKIRKEESLSKLTTSSKVKRTAF